MRISSLLNHNAITSVASYSGATGTAASGGAREQDGGQGLDKVTLSAEGLQRSRQSQTSSSSDSYAKVVAKIKEEIERVKAEIEEIESSNLPPELKEQQVTAKQRELSTLQAQLVNALVEQQKSQA